MSNQCFYPLAHTNEKSFLMWIIAAENRHMRKKEEMEKEKKRRVFSSHITGNVKDPTEKIGDQISFRTFSWVFLAKSLVFSTTLYIWEDDIF